MFGMSVSFEVNFWRDGLLTDYKGSTVKVHCRMLVVINLHIDLRVGVDFFSKKSNQAFRRVEVSAAYLKLMPPELPPQAAA